LGRFAAASPYHAETETWLRLVLVALAPAALAYAAWHLTRPRPPAVELATIARGTVKACRRARLAPVAGGQIVKLWVKENASSCPTP